MGLSLGFCSRSLSASPSLSPSLTLSLYLRRNTRARARAHTHTHTVFHYDRGTEEVRGHRSPVLAPPPSPPCMYICLRTGRRSSRSLSRPTHTHRCICEALFIGLLVNSVRTKSSLFTLAHTTAGPRKKRAMQQQTQPPLTLPAHALRCRQQSSRLFALKWSVTACTYTHTRARAHTHTQAVTDYCVCVCVCTCIYTHIYIHMHTYTHTQAHVHIFSSVTT